ncbi:uncharacterized protein LOC113228947 [Hyposmocoma kahamanoa]|uniref:uncharacterized protein LOC113228947 n=1 Tax=Hyposmocoma kahamanoa TaxID=1477025 RepID=UPI000E6DA468|nr:uncharacterized protein LOC113228947 [Hyposmocoma kahamanoa]
MVLTLTLNPEEVQEPACMIADLTTQMYFCMDPRTRKRSECVSESRKSFLADEKMECTLRRASFINASAGACAAIDEAQSTLKEDSLPVVNGREVEQLESAAINKMALLSAAVTRHLTAHFDPKNVDYADSVNSMNTIKELIPELATDAKALSSVRDSKSRQELLAEMEALCEAARRLCLLTESDDHDVSLTNIYKE